VKRARSLTWSTVWVELDYALLSAWQCACEGALLGSCESICVCKGSSAACLWQSGLGLYELSYIIGGRGADALQIVPLTGQGDRKRDAAAGPRSSALVGGHTAAHRQLERALAALKGTEDALLFPTGFAANLAAVSALACGAAQDRLG
jgi:hypothetical protein